MATAAYGPFRNGQIEVGGTRKCPCGKGNSHSLAEGGACDWQRRPVEQRNAILAKRQAQAEAA